MPNPLLATFRRVHGAPSQLRARGSCAICVPPMQSKYPFPDACGPRPMPLRRGFLRTRAASRRRPVGFDSGVSRSGPATASCRSRSMVSRSTECCVRVSAFLRPRQGLRASVQLRTEDRFGSMKVVRGFARSPAARPNVVTSQRDDHVQEITSPQGTYTPRPLSTPQGPHARLRWGPPKSLQLFEVNAYLVTLGPTFV